MTLVASVGALEACAKKGKGEGKRDKLPNFADRGTVQDDGPKTQVPPPPGGKDNDDPGKKDPIMDPEAKKILAACFDLPEASVADVVGWTDATASKDAANAVCALLDKAKYAKGVVNAQGAAVAID